MLLTDDANNKIRFKKLKELHFQNLEKCSVVETSDSDLILPTFIIIIYYCFLSTNAVWIFEINYLI